MSQITLPKFSVITTSYNHGEFIRDTIESVLAQGYANFEHIIIDGGSTDNTLSILKEYPHLKWISEPDRGQSHGLNKGFAKATGDIIAWINSDDWYAPGAFFEVAKAIENYPIVMGKCQFTDRAGNPTEEVENVGRTWFDALKYWVYHSCPAQPGIFFRRSIFAECGIDPENVLDEGLYFAMDYDLWMRIQHRYDLSKRIPQVLAYFRNYDTNKCGANMAGAYREMSRLFRRHSKQKVKEEQLFSFIYPFENKLEGIEPLLGIVARQSVRQTEILFSDYSSDSKQQRVNRGQILELEQKFPSISLRYLPANLYGARCAQEAFDYAIRDVRSELFSPLAECASLIESSTYVAGMIQAFSQDTLGILLHGLSADEERSVFQSQPSGVFFSPSGVLSLQTLRCPFAARTVAWLDCGTATAGSFLTPESAGFFKRILLILAHKAWRVDVGVRSDVWTAHPSSAQAAHQAETNIIENSAIIDEIARDLESSAFSRLRAQNGFAFSVPDGLIAEARQVLARAAPHR